MSLPGREWQGSAGGKALPVPFTKAPFWYHFSEPQPYEAPCPPPPPRLVGLYSANAGRL